MIDTSFLHQLDRLSLIINKRVTSNYIGERASLYTGKGLVFKDYTMYAPGEDFRMIDWKVFARTDKLFVKRQEEERNLVVHVIIDFSGSMGFGRKHTKSDYAAMLGIGFAYMAMKNNEKFVISTFAEELEVFRAQRGKAQLARIVQYLNKKKAGGKTQFEKSLARYKKVITSKSLVVIVSDFLYPVEEIKRVIYRFKKQDVYLIQVLDDVEKNLQLDGDYKLIDSESKSILRTFISPLLRKNYFGMLTDHNANIQKACSEIGAKFFSFGTDVPVFDAFYKMLS
ncbi:DUF58 domain-containing protein [Candidatus Woesearchaeota archaeon]|nr:DUF58 domain-containing protein [Candidatus Woesearchaeota archaeon]